jgi:hypothetical protein
MRLFGRLLQQHRPAELERAHRGALALACEAPSSSSSSHMHGMDPPKASAATPQNVGAAFAEAALAQPAGPPSAPPRLNPPSATGAPPTQRPGAAARCSATPSAATALMDAARSSPLLSRSDYRGAVLSAPDRPASHRSRAPSAQGRRRRRRNLRERRPGHTQPDEAGPYPRRRSALLGSCFLLSLSDGQRSREPMTVRAKTGISWPRQLSQREPATSPRGSRLSSAPSGSPSSIDPVHVNTRHRQPAHSTVPYTGPPVQRPTRGKC